MQLEQIKPLKDAKETLQEEVAKLKTKIDEIEAGMIINDEAVSAKNSSIKRVTPLGRDLEDALNDAKDELKTFIKEAILKLETNQMKKQADMES